jgi:GT2 family glycosyltransferase
MNIKGIIQLFKRYRDNPNKLRYDFSTIVFYIKNAGIKFTIKAIKDKISAIQNNRRWNRPVLAKYTTKERDKAKPIFAPLAKNPLVSIIIVNLNGNDHIQKLAESLAAQTYTNYEVIFVDNGSTDGSDILAEQLIPNCRVIRNYCNLGFAEGNNVGLDHALGDLVALLNNDVTLDSDWLKELVYTLVETPDCVAAIPKILFFRPFTHIKIECEKPFYIDRDQLVNSIADYKKIISTSDISHASLKHEFYIPAGTQGATVCIKFTEKKSDMEFLNVKVHIDGKKPEIIKLTSEQTVIVLDTKGASENYIINNVGTWISENGDCGDRGIYEVDLGQYDQKTTVDALCGCAAVIRRDALGNYPLFSPDFFAYYEDTELSIRLRNTGGFIVYCPSSRVYHKHASTSKEWSAQFRYLISRNKLLFLGTHFKHLVDKHLETSLLHWKHLQESLKNGTLFSDEEKKFIELIPQLIEETPASVERAKRGLIFLRKNPERSIGIYNEYWNTFGGGELRALHLAEALSKYGVVDLISPYPFSLEDLRTRFNIPLKRVRRMIIKEFSSNDTRAYSLFINSTYHSNLVSCAQKSFYLVSFPHIHATKDMLKSYDVFLANSEFTRKWVHLRWSPELDCRVFYPAVVIRDNNAYEASQGKEKIIVSVGRFFRSGHNKKQLDMVKCFKNLIKTEKLAKDWHLVLIGGCDLNDPSSISYLREVQNASSGSPITIIPNAPFFEVKKYLMKAAIYWHATGLNVEHYDPECLEHFGMAVAEAMSYGCIPIVYAHGGMLEVVGQEFAGLAFSSEEELIRKTLSLINEYELNPVYFKQLCKLAMDRAQVFDIEHHNCFVDRLIDEFIPGWKQ